MSVCLICYASIFDQNGITYQKSICQKRHFTRLV